MNVTFSNSVSSVSMPLVVPAAIGGINVPLASTTPITTYGICFRFGHSTIELPMN